VVAGLAGLGLGAVGVYYLSRSRPKAEEKAVDPVAADLPQHPGVKQDDNRASLCQLLSDYRMRLKQQQDLLADAEAKMRQIERQAEDICRVYAQDPTFKYNCNGWPVCSWNEWYTVSGTTTNQQANSACLTHLKTGSGLSLRIHELKPGGVWDDTWEDVKRINAQIADAYQQIQSLRVQYARAQDQANAARAAIADLERRISDLEAQGVFC